MSTMAAKLADIKREWHLIDLKGKVLGRAATDIASKLIGKAKPNYTPNIDCGDYVVVINAELVEVTGNKRQDKLYQHHSMHPGGFKEINFNDLMAKNPQEIILHAIQGMLPKNKLRDPRINRLKIFVGSDHPYQKQIEQSTKKAE